MTHPPAVTPTPDQYSDVDLCRARGTNVAVIYTGGTIGMVRGPSGSLVPDADYL